jgi:DNA replication and repair protein RecF
MASISGIIANLYLARFSHGLLQLNSITLTQFKNYRYQQFSFNKRIVGISGSNGIGKTNLLDAIYYLCFTKSYFSRTDASNMTAGCQGFRLEGTFDRNGEDHRVVCILRENGKKEIVLDDETYERFALHVGRFPCVFIAPDDTRIITEGSEERRRYIDALISQVDLSYLQRLIKYNKVLQQRNSYLKSLAENRLRPDATLLDTYDTQLADDGTYIHEKRTSCMRKCTQLVNSFYTRISGSNEQVLMTYESQLHKKSFAALLHESRERDIYLQRTTTGTHKDELILELGSQPFRNLASQGQRKSMLFAMKLAEFSMLKEAKGFAPLLLLDDVFEKLDAERMHNLLEWVCVENDGQIFITDTHEERIKQHLDKVGGEYEIVVLGGWRELS